MDRRKLLARLVRGAVANVGFADLPGSRGDITNDLSATVGDPNVYIQETKAFVCNVKKGVV